MINRSIANNIPLENYLLISAIGANRPNIISEISRTCVQCGCNLLNTKINMMGQELSLVLFLSGNWGAIAKMEAALPNLEKRLGLTIQTRRTHELINISESMVYTLQIIAIDRPGILNEVSSFLQKFSVILEEISAHTYLTHTQTRMAALQLKMSVPKSVHLATLREKFMTYCDDQNFEGYIEPLRNSTL